MVLVSSSVFLVPQDPAEASISLTHDEVISLVSSALMALLRRDMSLNRRLYAWLQGNLQAQRT